MKTVIVGGVAGGMSAAARLRRLSETAEIIVLERDRYVSFANCGLPYHVGGDIASRDSLVLQTPETLRASLDLDVRVGNEVVSIDRGAKIVTIRVVASGDTYEEQYDKLVLATGAAPIRPPLPGIDHPLVRTLRNIPDMDAVNELLANGTESAVVIGGGYIGLEMVEALRNRGVEVTLVEAQDQVMSVLDPEMAQGLLPELRAHEVRILLGTPVLSFRAEGDRVAVQIEGEDLVADLAILAIGVRPESGLARAAGLEIDNRGAVLVDEHLRTSDLDVYAVGDSVRVIDTVTGANVVVPLAGPANRQGRIAADHICGRNSSYSSTQGTGIVKVFNLTAALTGASERTLQRVGRAYTKIYLHPSGHASYYPGTHQMHLKVLFDPSDGALLGAQAVGRDGVDKRIDVLAVAIRAGLGIEDLENLELAYAPPFGSAKDPINMVGFMGANVLHGDTEFWFAEEYPDLPAGAFVLDVRNPGEHARWSLPDATLIPLPELRDRLAEIPADCTPYVLCRSGFRSYLAARVLRQSGWPRAKTLAGGELTFKNVHPEGVRRSDAAPILVVAGSH